MAQTLQNQITYAKSMNGIMTLSDGVTIMENGSISNVNNIDTNSINTSTFSSNDFQVSTNIDLTGDTSKLQFIYGLDPDNTLIDRNQITTKTLNATTLNISNVGVSDIDISGNIFFTPKANHQYGMYIDSVSSANNLFSYRGGEYRAICIGEGTPSISSVYPDNILIGAYSGSSLINGALNVAIGTIALNTATSGKYNVAMGYGALPLITNGEKNVGIGYGAGGDYAGYGYNSGNCTFLGSFARANFDDCQSSVALGYDCVVTESSTIQLGSHSEKVSVSGNLVMTAMNPYINSYGSEGKIIGFNSIENVTFDLDIISPTGVNIKSPTLSLQGNDITRVNSITMEDPNVGGIYDVNELKGNNIYGNEFIGNNMYGNQFIYSNFIKLNDLQTISTNAGTYTFTFPMPQIINVINAGSITLNLPDLTILPTGGAGTNIYILRGNNLSQVTLVAYSGQEIKLMDNSLVSSFLFNSNVSNMLNLAFTRVGGDYRWIQVSPIVSNNTTSGIIDTPSVYTLNTFTALNTFDVGIESYGSTYVENFTFSNVSSDISILNWNASIPTYTSTDKYLQYTGSGTYSGVGFTTARVSSTGTYNMFITRGLFVNPFFITYYPSGITSNQTFTLQTAQNTSMKFTTLQQLLDEGNYIFGFWVQNSNNTGGNIGFASVNVKDHVTSTIYASISNINPVASYPNWLFFSIPFSLSIDANIEFEFITSSSSHQFGGYINLVGLQLTRNSAMVINDQTSGKTATLGANQSILNNVFIREGLKVQSGGVQATGGLTTNTTFGTNNLSINSTMASTSGANNSVNNLAIGANALNALTTGSSNIAIGNGAFTDGTTNVRCISLGHTNQLASAKTGAICIGSNNSNRGNYSVVLGDNGQTTANGGVVGDFCVAVGGDSVGCSVYNGFSVLSSNHSVGVGYKALTNCSDDFNTSVGSMSFVNMDGRRGVTANGNSGAITQFNSALGYRAGNLRNRYNNCTFIGAAADAATNNLTNATAIGYNCIVDASNTIQIGSNGERVIISGDLSGVTTINGVPYSPSGGETLTQTLALGNSAGTYDIDMNNNDILNVSNINLVNINGSPYSPSGGETLTQTLALGNSAGTYDIDMNNNDILNVSNINLVNINGSPYSPSGGETLTQTLALGNSAGTYDIDMNNNDILNVSNINLTNINGSPYSSGITLAQVQANANVFSLLQTLQSGFFNYKIFLSLTGGQTNYINDTSVFGRLIVCIANTSIGSFISLPDVSISNGADISVLNRSNTSFGLSSGAIFLGKFGNRSLLIDILAGVCVKLYCDGTNWNIYEYSGLAQQVVYRNTGSLLVTSGGINTPSFPTFNNISWQSSRLTQSPAGVFVNNTGYDLTLAVSYTMTWNNKVNSTNNTTGSNSNGIRSTWILHSDTTTYPKFLGTNNLGTRSTTDTTGTQANIFFTTLQYQTAVSSFILKNGANFRPQLFQTNNVISGGTGVYLISTSQLDAIALTITILP